jgi:hypothetical protein
VTVEPGEPLDHRDVVAEPAPPDERARFRAETTMWAALAVLVPLTLWVASLPAFTTGVELFAVALAFTGWTVLGLGWVAAIWLTGARGHLRDRALTRWVLPPLLVGALGTAAAVDAPERWRFAASHGALDDLAAAALAEPGVPPQPDRVGRYDVERVDVRRGDVLVWLDGGLLRTPVLVHVGSGPFSELDAFGDRASRCAEVGDRWWLCTRDDG